MTPKANSPAFQTKAATANKEKLPVNSGAGRPARARGAGSTADRGPLGASDETGRPRPAGTRHPAARRNSRIGAQAAGTASTAPRREAARRQR